MTDFSGASLMPDYGASSTSESITWYCPPVNTGCGDAYVRTNFERMQASFDKSPLAVTGSVVNYIDFERDHTGLGQVFTHVTTKDLPYSDEREFRLLLWQHDQSNESLFASGDGLLTDVDPRMLIERVIRNPFQAELPRALAARLEELGIPYDDSGVKYKASK